MCGICGVVQVAGPPRQVVPDEVLAAMTDAMTHRGPDDRGLLVEPGLALGVRRLSVVDVAGGHQPFANERQNVWAIQNGELYNHEAVRRELVRDGHRFRSRCDTEILPHLYERDGARFPTRLRGMFAIAVWDRSRRRLVLARDRLGVKPLYYAQRDDLLVFASELKSLLACGLIEPELDRGAIDAYLTLSFFPGPSTPLAGVSKLMPGCTLVVEDGVVQEAPYWRYPAQQPGPVLTEEDYRARLLELLEESVRLRLMSDVPVGAMLSGGLDSSMIVALMAGMRSGPVKTFAVGFEGSAQSELADARRMAEQFGTDHCELELSARDDALDLAELVWHLDEPVADLSSVGFYALCELAARDVTVALSGQGADELFAGYRKHVAATYADRWQRLPRRALSVGRALAPHAPRRFQRAAATLTAPDATERLLAMSGRLDDDLRARLLRGPLAPAPQSPAREAVRRRLDGVADLPLPATLHVDAQLALVDDMLHYFDRMSMAHSLEVRVPFLDHELVEFAATVPPELKIRGGTTKYLLRAAADGLVPAEALRKPKVGFFTGDVTRWLGAHLDASVREFLLQPDPAYSELLEPAEVRRLVASHGPRTARHDSILLFSILMLEIWLSTFLPRARSLSRAAVAGAAT